MLDVIALADGIVTLLNAGNFTEVFEAKRVLIPDFTVDDLAGLTVSVVPNTNDFELATRVLTEGEYQIDIGIQKKLDGESKAEIEQQTADLVIILQQIMTYLLRRPVPTDPAAYWTKTANDVIYDLKHLKESKVFTTVITNTYKATF